VLHLDWWFDSRRIEESVVSSIAEGFSTAVLDLVREAIAEDDLATADAEDGEMTLVELS
jgi:phthiocerol/phenolphthiocerol synthesis type-I polyketide synthase E